MNMNELFKIMTLLLNMQAALGEEYKRTCA
jgi:hypothetical protein